MGWQEDHAKHVARFPPQIQAAHRHSIHHRDEITHSNLCGCFYCCATFPPSDVTEWVDEGSDGHGQTALCPKCGIDSVIGDRSGFPLSRDFLLEMNSYWF
jgi:hypothetical protein